MNKINKKQIKIVFLKYSFLFFCASFFTNSIAIADDIKNISLSPLLAYSKDDKGVMENDLKNIEFSVKVNKHQSISSDFLSIGIKIYNGSSKTILLADLQELCLENIVDTMGLIPDLPRKISKIYTSRPGGETNVKWITVLEKSEKVIPFFVKNPSIILGRKKIINGNYKIKFVCSINVKKADSVKILSVPLSSGYAEFDFTDNP